MDAAQNQYSPFAKRTQCCGNQFAGRSEDYGRIQWFRWLIESAAAPFRAQLHGKATMLFFAGRNEDLRAPVSRNLNADVAGCAEAIDAQIRAGADLRDPQGAKSNDARAQKWSSLQVRKAVGNGIDEVFFRKRVLRISAVD